MKNDFVLFIERIQLNPKRWFNTIFWILLILAIGWITNLIWYKPYSIELFYERMFLKNSMEHPEEMSKYGLYEQYWLKRHNKELNNVSQEQQIKEFEYLIKQYDMLLSYKRSRQTKEQLISTDILNYALDDIILKQQFPFYEFPIDHINGIHVQLPLFMLEVNQINTFQDAENYINRLSLFEKQFTQMEERIQMASDFGTVPPIHLVKQMEKEISIFLKDGALSNLLYNDFQKKIKSLNNLPQVSLGEFNYDLKLQIENNVITAYNKLALSIAELEYSAPQENFGVYRFDDGFGYYSYLLKHHLAVPPEAVYLTLTTDSLLRIAENELASLKPIEASLLFSLGYEPEKGIRNVMETIEKNLESKYFYKNDSLGQKDLINDLNLVLYDVESQGNQNFSLKTNVEIVCKAMPTIMNSFPLTYYYPSDFLNKRKASLYINMSEMKTIPKFAFKNLIIESIWPGVHLQISAHRTNSELPSFRRAVAFTSFTDGWRRYAKDLAMSNNMYSNDLEKLAKVQSDLVDVCKMICDIKIHTNEWSYNEAVDFLVDTSGIHPTRAKKEIDWIIVEPARACAYLVGYKNLLSQIKKAKNRLGERFNLNKLHQSILENGPVPVALSEKIVADFIEKESLQQ